MFCVILLIYLCPLLHFCVDFASFLVLLFVHFAFDAFFFLSHCLPMLRNYVHPILIILLFNFTQPFSIFMHYFIIAVFFHVRGVVVQTVEQGACDWNIYRSQKVSLCVLFVF